ncbi:MAG TPA: sterol desaturase family protein [Myxococcaceae bacterium]|nr:sterol desaturase family protein [Myxococcaceae bacterium]
MKQALIIASAIPFFLLAMGFEVWVARRRKVSVYRFADAVADLSCGVTQQVWQAVVGVAYVALYVRVYEALGLLHFAPWSPWPWALAFLGVDFGYYWWHRWSHEVNVLWAAHVVHHSSEDYNLAVALRQAVGTGPTFLFIVGVPMAALGVPPVPYAVAGAFSLLYQFWIHTQLIGTLGPLEELVNTPSLHRVHHATNPRYLDRNYGGTLIVWDKLFGTYQREDEKPTYGITKPLRSYNPLWAQAHYWAELFAMAKAAPRWADKLRVWVAGPAWRPRDLPAPPRDDRPPYDPRPSVAVTWYVAAQFSTVVAATFLLLLLQTVLPRALLAAGAGLVVLSLVAWSGLTEGKRWGWPLEVGRLVLILAAAAAVAAGVLS